MRNDQNIHVAVIDDDESVCRSLSRLLRAYKLLPTTYSSAEAFLADANHPTFDCLVLDIQLRGMSGVELSERLAAGQNHIPVVFITAHDDPGLRARAEVAGCAGFFRKTDAGADVLAVIRRVIGLHESGASGTTTQPVRNEVFQ